MLSDYAEKTRPFYDSLQNLSLEGLISNARRRIDTHGGIPSLVDKKSAAIKSIKDTDHSFLKVIHRSLSEEILHGLRTMFTENCSVDRSSSHVVSMFMIYGKTNSRTLNTSRQFSENTELSPSLIDLWSHSFKHVMSVSHKRTTTSTLPGGNTLSGKEATFFLLRLTQSYHWNSTIVLS